MFNYTQFREKIVRPVLHGLGMWNEHAEDLMMGTCAVESQGGTYLVQLNHGPAVGVFQMEPLTHDDIWKFYLPNNPAIAGNLMQTCQMAIKPRADYMLANLFYACAMARIQYYRSTPDSIPDSEEGRAAYWVKYYNRGGAGTIEKYIKAHALWRQGVPNEPTRTVSKKGANSKT